MMPTYAHQKQLQEARLDMKTLERLFANLITDGTNCSPFESDIIVEKAKEVFAIGDHAEGNVLHPGQMVWTAIDIAEPPGKPLKQCQLKRIVITHINATEDAEVRKAYGRRARFDLPIKFGGGYMFSEDAEVRRSYGPSAKRRQQILRMSVEAKDQGALLTQEDLAVILDTDVRTIRRDIQQLRNQNIFVPTRGQQKDIGPGVTHRVQAINMFLAEKEPGHQTLVDCRGTLYRHLLPRYLLSATISQQLKDRSGDRCLRGHGQYLS